ncbi:AprI/Inh family metalloprotease inhibitor [Stappia sp.]|uniref:AprI/Inh family metalloprotease inhibitor n=1 Tax=Stappia sp. TaxID=1870903 RepID=UPI0032D930A4
MKRLASCLRPLALTPVLALALAACQTAPSTQRAAIAPTAATGFAQPGPVFGAAPAAQPIRRTTTLSSDSKSWVDADGTRHTKTSRSTASVSLDPNAVGSAVAMLLGGSGIAPSAPARQPGAGDYAGTWRLDVAGKQCDLTLQAPGGRPSGTATTFGCLGTDLGNVTGWSLRGREVILTGLFDKQLAVLRATGGNRLDGTTPNGSALTAWR